jgi:hypothetical protein
MLHVVHRGTGRAGLGRHSVNAQVGLTLRYGMRASRSMVNRTKGVGYLRRVVGGWNLRRMGFGGGGGQLWEGGKVTSRCVHALLADDVLQPATRPLAVRSSRETRTAAHTELICMLTSVG